MPQIVKDILFSLVVSACSAGILAAAVGTLGSMLGWFEGNEVMLSLYLMIAIPLFLISIFIFTRSSKRDAEDGE